MSDPSSAVFISYASEDAAAARRIADALRASGLNVWIDASELRGGDQWDAKIRRQIKECALFVPIISRTTETRREAYFRLEWKLADDRTHLMAPGTAFVVPVVIDEIKEYDASVPDSFSRAQWMRLPGGEPTPDFVAQVVRLISDPETPVGPVPGRHPSVGDQSRPANSSTAIPRGMPAWGWGLAGVAAGVVAIAVVLMLRPAPGPEATPASVNETSPAPADRTVEPSIFDRTSIAVLPFTNMSENPEASSFFADGVHEDLLTNLSYIGGLRVVSRTSVMLYRNTVKSAREIASELRVGTLLEGSVRRAGDRVRVTAQLIDAMTDEHIWAQTYDREVTDIFAIQSELAKSIAQALRIALTERQAKHLDKPPTGNLAAYELCLRERELVEREGNSKERVQESIGLMQRAVALDPEFAVAWANLAVLNAQSHFWYFDRTDQRLAQAEAAIKRALALAPDDLDVKTYAGSYYYYAHRDYARAADYYQEVLAVAPNHIGALSSLGFIRRREGRWRESLQLHERVLQMDPRNVPVLMGIVTTYHALRHYDRAIAHQRRLHEMMPTALHHEMYLVLLETSRAGNVEPMREWIARYASVTEDVPVPIWRGRMTLAMIDDLDQAVRLLADPPAGVEESEILLERAWVAVQAGDTVSGEELAAKLVADRRAALVQTPSDIELRTDLLKALCLLRDERGARDELERIKSQLQGMNDALESEGWRFWEGMWLAWFGAPEDAVAALRHAARHAGMFKDRVLLLVPGLFSPIADTPEFQALVADDAAWAPIPIE